MEVLYPRCAGFDVHKKTVKVCLMVQEGKGPPKKILRTYKTMTADLLEMRDWLAEEGCTHIAMEATGVYWRPIFNLLGADFALRARQCASYQGGCGTQDRCEGCGVDC